MTLGLAPYPITKGSWEEDFGNRRAPMEPGTARWYEDGSRWVEIYRWRSGRRYTVNTGADDEDRDDGRSHITTSWIDAWLAACDWIPRNRWARKRGSTHG